MKTYTNYPNHARASVKTNGSLFLYGLLITICISFSTNKAWAHPCPACEHDQSQSEDRHADFDQATPSAIIHVTNSNEIILADRLYTLDEAIETIRQISRETLWIIRGEPQANWGICMQLYQAIQEAGFEQVALTVAEIREPVAIRIDLDEEGTIQIDSQTYTPQELQEHLTDLHQTSPDATCTIRLHPSSRHEHVRPVLDCFTQAGFETVNMRAYTPDSPTP